MSRFSCERWMGASKSIYIAVIGSPDSGKNEIMNIYKQKREEKRLKMDPNIADLGIWFQYNKSNICAFQISDDPNKWVDELKQRLNNNQLNAIVLAVNASKFQDTSEFMIYFNRNHFDLIMTNWQRNMTKNHVIIQPILDLIYENITEIYNTKKVYRDFLFNNFEINTGWKATSEYLFTNCALGISHNESMYDNNSLSVNQMVGTENLDLSRLRHPNWYIQTASPWSDHHDGIDELLHWFGDVMKQK